VLLEGLDQLKNPMTSELLHFYVLFVESVGSRDSVEGIATSYRLDDRGIGFRGPVWLRIFSSPCRPDRLWGPPNLLFNGYQGLFPQGYNGRA
jgi:hypothetical protein